MKFIKSNSASKSTDEELIREYKNVQDTEIVAQLFDRYVHLVFGVCMKYLEDEDAAKDASMEVFEQLFASLLSHEVTYFKSWLYRVAQNHCLMKLRTRKSQIHKLEAVKVEEQFYMENDADLHQERMNNEFLFENLPEAMNRLSEEQKICVSLFYYDKKSYQDISEQTHFPIPKVKSYIQNGKRNMKIYLQSIHENKANT